MPIKDDYSVDRSDQETLVDQPDISDADTEITGSTAIIENRQPVVSKEPLPGELLSQTSSFFSAVTPAISSFILVIFQKLFKFTERIFMFLIAGLVILTIVFVLTYLSGSGFSSIGLF